MKSNLKTLMLGFATFFFAATVMAGVESFSGTAAEKLFIESAPKLGKEVYLIKFEGVESAWANQVIKTTRTKASSGYRYGFEYDLELSSGIQKRHYNMLVESGQTLKNGSLVKQIELYMTGSKDPKRLTYDEALTKTSQTIQLAAEFKKKPFAPEVD